MSNQLEQQSNCEKIEDNQLHVQFAKLLNKILNLAGDEHFEEFNQTILQKCQESSQESFKVLSDLIESIIKNLVNKLEQAQSLLQMDINKSDYQILEASAQKAEAEHQQKIYQEELEEKVRSLEVELLKAQNKIKMLQLNIQRYEREQKKMTTKIQKFQQKMYEVNREGKWASVDKSYDQLIHKASLNLKQKQKIQPYLQNATKSKHMISRKKEGYKLFKERGSKILCFDSLKSKNQCSDSSIIVRDRHSISQHASKIGPGLVFSQINQSIQMLQPDRKRKKRLLKHVTEASDKNNNRSSLYL